MNWRALTDLIVWRQFRDEPDVCRGMRRLFNQESTVRVIHAEPVDRKFRLTRIGKAVEQWKRKHAA